MGGREGAELLMWPKASFPRGWGEGDEGGREEGKEGGMLMQQKRVVISYPCSLVILTSPPSLPPSLPSGGFNRALDKVKQT
jgi:hypothetical protein